MENIIGKMLELEDGKKYAVMRQALYRGDSYFIANKLTDDGEDTTNEFAVLHAFTNEGDTMIEQVTDTKMMELIMKYTGMKD